MVEYAIKDTPQDKITHIVKILQGFSKEDRRWNTLNYARVMKSAKTLYGLFDHEECKLKKYATPLEITLKCIEDLVNEFKTREITWTVETIVRRSGDWERQVARYGKYMSYQYGL